MREKIFKRIATKIATKFAHHPRQPTRGIFILTPTASGSLGDEAMVRAMVECVNKKFPREQITLAIWSKVDEHTFRDLNVKFLHVGKMLSQPFGLRTALGLTFKELLRIVRCLRGASRVFILGADVLDGKYSTTRSVRRFLFAEICSHLGINTAIIGFSFSDQANNLTREALRTLPHTIRLACRDPVSAARVRVITDRHVESNADLAFLLEPQKPCNEHAKKVISDIDARRTEGRAIIAINVNRQAFGKEVEKNPEIALEMYEQLVREIANKRPSTFLLIPHDVRGRHSDYHLLHRLAFITSPDIDAFSLPKDLRASEAKYFAGKADLVITGRMHLAIASIGTQVPVLVHDYQGKVQGLLSIFGLEDYSFTSSSLRNSEYVAAKALEALDNKSDLEKKISCKLPEVRGLSLRNIDGDEASLEALK